jgi:hypothetical protein
MMGWLAAGAGLLVLGLVGYGIVVDRSCGELSDVPRGSFRFRMCRLGTEVIATIPVSDPIGEATYSLRDYDGLKPGVNEMKYASARPPAEVRAVLEAFLAGKGFALARREIDFEWWSDKRTEMAFSIHGRAGRGCDVEVIHVGFE